MSRWSTGDQVGQVPHRAGPHFLVRLPDGGQGRQETVRSVNIINADHRHIPGNIPTVFHQPAQRSERQMIVAGEEPIDIAGEVFPKDVATTGLP